MLASKSFISTLRTEVGSTANRLKQRQFRAFHVWFAQFAFDLSEEEALEAANIDGANDKKIDLFFMDHDNGKVLIYQGKYSEKGTHKPKISEVDSLSSCLNWLASPEALRRDGKPELADAAEQYLEAVRDGYGIELWFVYAGPKCANVEKHIAVYNHNQENIDARRSLRHCDLAMIQAYHEQSSGDVKRLKEEKVKLLPRMHFKYHGDFGKALVATIQSSELVRLYKAHEDRLFDRNVRLFLGTKKGSVNAEISQTLKSAERSNFWAYNNGLTFVCSEFAVRNNAVKMKTFCIVNGCQSTRSLVDNESSLNSSVTVLVRVLAVGNDLVDDVIRYTNSQNPIRAWDLASQFKTQRRLKRDFDAMPKPYLYVTRRGDQPRRNALAKYRNGGSKPRQFKLADVGQYVAAMIGKPVMAYKNKAFIFLTHHDDVFPHDIKAEEVLFAYLCSEHVKEVVAQRRTNDGTSETERRILLKGGSIFVMAVLGHVARLRNGATYLKSLAQERLVSNLAKQRFKKYALYAVEAYLNAANDTLENRADELATVIRQPQFFESVRGRVTRAFNKDRLAGEDWLKNVLPKLG